MNTNITNVVNYLVEQNNYKKYLEIGVWDGRVFNKVVCDFRCGIDKRVKISYTTSDKIKLMDIESSEFFAQNNETFDIIVLSRKNSFESIKQDLNNALKILSENGTIVINNCNPTEDDVEKNGEAYKVVTELRHDSFSGLVEKLKVWTVEVEGGACIIRKENTKVKDNENSLKKIFSKSLKGELMNWSTFSYYKSEIMNIIKFANFLDIFNTEFDEPATETTNEETTMNVSAPEQVATTSELAAEETTDIKSAEETTDIKSAVEVKSEESEIASTTEEVKVEERTKELVEKNEERVATKPEKTINNKHNKIKNKNRK